MCLAKFRISRKIHGSLLIRLDMDSNLWRIFFEVSIDTLGEGSTLAALSPSWCSWTTFDRLKEDAGYWTSGLPNRADLRETYLADGGTWGQPFHYSSLAHIVIPRTFFWERVAPGSYENGEKSQAIGALSSALESAGVTHRLTELVLEIKLY